MISEYCNYDYFNPQCETNEVIVVMHALYGRMKIGRCLTKDFFIGCSADVLNILDKLCSGRHECKVSIPNQAMDTAVNCIQDLHVYLEASFICQKGNKV